MLDKKSFERWRDWVYEASGISFNEGNRSVLESRLHIRLKELGLTDPEVYFRRVLENEEEKRAFLDFVTTNLTRFFRHQAHFDLLKEDTFPRLVESKRVQGDNKIIRIWSAGCSSGEEPYSLAILAKKVLPEDFSFTIFASDLSLKSLMVAQKAWYSREKVEVDIHKEFREEFFQEKNGGYEVLPSLKAMINLQYHNLQHPFQYSAFDIVFCRNVLIYFDQSSQKVVLQHLCDAMKDESYLFIGHSESLIGLDTGFELYSHPRAIIYRKKGGGH